MSDSSSVQLYYRPETTWGENPAGVSPAALREFRQTSESLNFTTVTAQSEEIRADRQVTSIARVGVTAPGEVNFEMSYGSYDDLLEGVFANDWGPSFDVNGSSNTLSLQLARSSTSPIEGRLGIGSPVGGPVASPNPFRNLVPGQFIRITRSTTSPTCDGFYRFLGLSGTGALRLWPAPPVSTSGFLRVTSSHLQNGTTRKSFLLEKKFADIDEYIYFTGMRAGSMSLNLAPGAIMTGSMGFQGKFAFSSTNSIATGITPVTVSTSGVMNTVDNISNVRINDLPTNLKFTRITLNVENGLRPQPALANLAPIGIGLGRFIVTGSIVAYFEDRALYEQYLTFKSSKLSFTVTDEAGASYLFYFADLKFTDGRVVTPGNDADIVVELDFMAKRHATEGFTLALDRFAA